MVEDFKKIKSELSDLKKKKNKKRVDSVVKKLSKGFLKRPKTKLPSVNPKKFITYNLKEQALVKEGRTGHFNKEYMEEKINWLS